MLHGLWLLKFITILTSAFIMRIFRIYLQCWHVGFIDILEDLIAFNGIIWLELVLIVFEKPSLLLIKKIVLLVYFSVN